MVEAYKAPFFPSGRAALSQHHLALYPQANVTFLYFIFLNNKEEGDLVTC